MRGKVNCTACSIAALFVFLSAVFGCAPEEGPDLVRVNKEVERRVNNYKALKRGRCIAAIVKEVEEIVDSTLLAKAQSQVDVKEVIPTAGERPSKPEIEFPKFKIEKQD